MKNNVMKYFSLKAVFFTVCIVFILTFSIFAADYSASASDVPTFGPVDVLNTVNSTTSIDRKDIISINITKDANLVKDCVSVPSYMLGFSEDVKCFVESINGSDRYNLIIYIGDNSIRVSDDASYLFFAFTNVEKISGLNNLDVSHVTNMSYMFGGCHFLKTLDLTGWDTSNVTDMSNMFNYCGSLTTLTANNLNTSNVTNMSGIFNGCGSIGYVSNDGKTNKPLNLSSWNTQNVTDMSYAFAACTMLTSPNISNWNTIKVENMEYMFAGCTYLTNLNLTGWNTPNLKNTSSMFSNCINLTSLNIASLDMTSVRCASDMFKNDNNLAKISVSNTFNANRVVNLPKPKRRYISDANGLWYDANGIKYSHDEVVGTNNTTFYAYPF